MSIQSTLAITKIIHDCGYFETQTTYDQFVALAWRLGTPVSSRRKSPYIDVLQPKSKQDAAKHSLSNQFGIDCFPFHTDGAYLTIPPRYVLLRYSEGIEKPTPTLLLPMLIFLTDEEKDILKKDFWWVRGRSFNFYTTTLETCITKCERIRYDPGCMVPITRNDYLGELIHKKVKLAPIIEIDWIVGKTLVLDNWKLLHSRPKIDEREINYRTLQRIMTNE